MKIEVTPTVGIASCGQRVKRLNPASLQGESGLCLDQAASRIRMTGEGAEGAPTFYLCDRHRERFLTRMGATRQ